MKNYAKKTFIVFLLFTCMFLSVHTVQAAPSDGDTRAISIVFDNSGSMYVSGNQAWCQATYAMEVFASMLNKGDTLMIYPMHAITVDGAEYTMDNPLKVTKSSEASKIRSIFTKVAGGTPIESVDKAIQDLKVAVADKKYMIVLTDGDAFYSNNKQMSAGETRRQLDKRFQTAGADMSVMYLGIGEKVVMPDTEQSEFFAKAHAKNSADVLSTLTNMCNQIFGRDTLPKSRINGKNIEFDISMNKLIVFVQGENVSNVKLVSANGTVLVPISSSSAMYGTAGCGNYDSIPDKSLQGMMVTYGSCSAGAYTIEYSGNATSVEVYYEPNADLDFVFSDPNGNIVDPESLYEGEYKVSFGMKDAETGRLIESDLLGNPSYRGNYRINDDSYPITHDGHSSFVPVALKMNDAFDANLTVTYLSGYTISKNSLDFGWPFGGIKVAARPAGDLVLEISGGDSKYSLEYLEAGTPYVAKVFYQGVQLTGEELEKVDLKWDPELSNAEITKDFAGDHYDLYLEYKNPEAPTDTVCGKCTVFIYAYYTAPGSDEAEAQSPLSYNIEDNSPELQFDLYAESNYIVISELEKNGEIVAKLSFKGAPLSQNDFAATTLTVDCGGINYEVVPHEQDSTYLIKLLPTEGVDEGGYQIKASVAYTDNIGRTTQLEDSVSITLSNIPLWLKWLFWIVILLIIIIIIVIWLRTPVLPKKIKIINVSVKVGGKDMNNLKATVNYPSKGKRRSTKIKGTGDLVAASVSLTLVPAKDSYRYLPSKKRKALVVNGSVTSSSYVDKIEIGAKSFARNRKDGKMTMIDESTNNFTFPQGQLSYSGIIDINGRSTKYVITGDIKFE